MSFIYQQEVKELALSQDLSYEKIKAFFNNLADKMGIQGGDAAETMSRLKGIWALQFGREEIYKEIQQMPQGSKYDFELHGEKYEVKARRNSGDHKYDWYYFVNVSSGVGCELDKTDYADKFICVTSDGYAWCFDAKKPDHIGFPERKVRTDYESAETKRSPMAYYFVRNCKWEVRIAGEYWEPWKIIDEVWENQKPK